MVPLEILIFNASEKLKTFALLMRANEFLTNEHNMYCYTYNVIVMIFQNYV